MRSKHKLFPTTIATNAAIAACAKGSPKQAIVLFSRMKKDKIEPSVLTYSSLIDACNALGNWEKALKLFDEMKSRDIIPDAIAYAAIIGACDSGKQYNVAEKFYRTACDLKHFSHWHSRGIIQGESVVVDFHDHRITTAKVALRVILEEVALEGIDDKDLVLVVGKGLRSEGGNVLGPTLLELLRRAVPPLNGRLMDTNRGRIVVSNASLVAWIAERKKLERS